MVGIARVAPIGLIANDATSVGDDTTVTPYACPLSGDTRATIVVEPDFTIVTNPVAETVATVGIDDSHVTGVDMVLL